MSKTVYFLGAGATKAVEPNAPLDRDLLEKALNDFRDQESAQDILDFIKDIFPGRSSFPKDNRIWDLLDYLIQRNKSANRYDQKMLRDLKNKLLTLVVYEYEKSLANTRDDATYREFAGKISRGDSAVISPNHDILIDNALRQYSRNYGSKFRSAVSEDNIHFQRGMKRPIVSGDDKNLNAEGIPLLKIHGSLNWLYCPKCDEVDVALGKGAMKALAGELYCCNENCTQRYESLLITAAMFKNYDNRVIKEVWDRAEEELANADELVFVGYAMKESDYQIRCLLMNALLRRGKAYRKVSVVERDEEGTKHSFDIETRFRDLYGEIDFMPIGFKKFVEEMG